MKLLILKKKVGIEKCVLREKLINSNDNAEVEIEAESLLEFLTRREVGCVYVHNVIDEAEKTFKDDGYDD